MEHNNITIKQNQTTRKTIHQFYLFALAKNFQPIFIFYLLRRHHD